MTARCEDCQRCEADGCDAIAFCLSQPGTHPCPHDGVWCEAHNLTECIHCRLDAEAHMHKSGDYDPRSDPFYRPEREAADLAYWERPALTFPGSPGFKKEGDA